MWMQITLTKAAVILSPATISWNHLAPVKSRLSEVFSQAFTMSFVRD